MAEVKLNNDGVAGNEYSTRKYVDAAGLQALIDKIGALRTSLKNADEATARDAAEALETAKNDLNELITANTEADTARNTRLTTVEGKVKTIEETTVPGLDSRIDVIEAKGLGNDTDYVKAEAYATDKQALEKADSDEAKTRGDADTALGNRIKAIEDLSISSNYVTNATYNTKMTEIDEALDNILAALNNAVVAADVNAAFESATADAPAPEA